MKRLFFRCCTVIFLGVFFICLCESAIAEKQKIMDPWKLGKFIKSNKIPPEDLLVFLRIVTVAPEGSGWYNFINNDIFKAISDLTNSL